MIEFLTAGESHGRGLTTIVTGFPSNLKLSDSYINEQLKRRQAGYGRGLRMKIETDSIEFVSGVRHGKTIGSPISMIIWNKDWENWSEIMSSYPVNSKIEKITIPRPGHADLVGTQKYNYNDIRNSIDRSSARETASRVAACSIARKFLTEFGIHVGSFVENIGGIYPKENYAEKFILNKLHKNFNAEKLNQQSDNSPVRVFDNKHEERIINKIKTAKKKGNTLGGTFYVIASGLPPGLGSFIQYNTKLDAELAHAVMSIHAVKGVEIGIGFNAADLFGSNVHDEILFKNENFIRKTNRAGGIEGGISNGMPIILRAAMKPIATLMNPISSVELSTLKPVKARRERSDFTAVPACAVIAESMVAWSIAKFFLNKFGGDSMEETKDNFINYNKKLLTRIKKNFKS